MNIQICWVVQKSMSKYPNVFVPGKRHKFRYEWYVRAILLNYLKIQIYKHLCSSLEFWCKFCWEFWWEFWWDFDGKYDENYNGFSYLRDMITIFFGVSLIQLLMIGWLWNQWDGLLKVLTVSCFDYMSIWFSSKVNW